MDRDRGRRSDRNYDSGSRGDRSERGSGSGDRNFIKPNYFLPKPVKVGDVVDVTVEAVASKGDGIAKKDGFVIFIKDAKQGAAIKAKITEVRARYALAEAIGEDSATQNAEASATSDETESENSDSEESSEE
jgi:predicted RNA-binding protein with TRAM domain